jgi:hypothetical protein
VWAEWALEECLPEVAYRQWVFSLPKALRVYFRFDPELSKGLSRMVVNELTRYMREVTGPADLEPGFVVWDHTFGTPPDSYHPHPHVCATEGGYLPDGRFAPLLFIAMLAQHIPHARKHQVRSYGACTPAVEPAARSRTPPQFEEGFFVDPDYSEFDCIDEPPEVDRQPSRIKRIKGRDSRPPRGILELVDHYPGTKLCWATQLLEDEEKKE